MTLRGSSFLGLVGLAWLVVGSAAACNGGVTNGESASTGSNPPAQCPASRPSEGDACDTIGDTCTYVETWGDDECGEPGSATLEVTCTDSGWSIPVYKCSEPPPCPGQLPVAGTDCSEWYDSWGCTFTVETECGPAFASASCDGDLWQVTVQSECESCATLSSAAACEGVEGCRWLAPGCGESAPVLEGCYPELPCTPDSCDEGETCATVSYNPCLFEPCDACAADTDVCVSLEL